MTFSDILEPEPGERVVLVPQAYSYLLTPQSRFGMVGKCADGLGPHLGDRTMPHWVTYQPLHHPGWGYGLLLVREGWCYRGPCQWDSGD